MGSNGLIPRKTLVDWAPMSIADHPRIDAGDSPAETRAFESLWEEHGVSLSSFFMARGVTDRDARADLIQETYLRAFGSFECLADRGSFRSWMHTMASNALVDTYRRKPRFVSAILESDAVIEPADAGRFGMEPPAIAILNEERQAVAEALGKLRGIYARAVRMHYFEYLPLKEIAGREGVPVGTVKRRLHKARKTIAAILKGDEFDSSQEEKVDYRGFGIVA